MRPLYLIGIAVLCASCASVVSKTVYPVRISSNPQDAEITIINRKGKEVYSGKTPAAVPLRSGGGFFRRGIYTINFSKEGFKESSYTLSAGINGWYFGNFAIGGALGFLIIDPATGAMYRLKTEVFQPLDPEPSTRGTLTIKTIGQLSVDERKNLEKIN